jgi:hypothetical protein
MASRVQPYWLREIEEKKRFSENERSARLQLLQFRRRKRSCEGKVREKLCGAFT